MCEARRWGGRRDEGKKIVEDEKEVEGRWKIRDMMRKG